MYRVAMIYTIGILKNCNISKKPIINKNRFFHEKKVLSGLNGHSIPCFGRHPFGASH